MTDMPPKNHSKIPENIVYLSGKSSEKSSLHFEAPQHHTNSISLA